VKLERADVRGVFFCGLAGLLLAGLYAIFAPSWFTARLAVVTLKRSPSGLMGQGASELRELGATLPGLPSSDTDRVAAVLQSDSVTDAVIEKFDLRKRYNEKYLELAREELWKHCAVRVQTKGDVVILTCEDKDPAQAQAMASYFGEFGNDTFRRVDRTSASEEVLFLDAHLLELRLQAGKAQASVRAFEEQNKIVQIDEQAKAVVDQIATLRAQQVAKELELSYAKGFTASSESSTVQLRRVLAVLAEKEKSLSEGQKGQPAELFPPALAIPALRARWIELELDRKFYEQSVIITMERMEAARSNQARDVSTFQVLDAPVLPTYRSRPKRLFIVALGVLAGLLLGVAWRYGPGYVKGLMREAE
jgi:tyrosine-protein kinase Etk/Wzc